MCKVRYSAFGKEIRELRELRLTPSKAAAGGKYNGKDLKLFLCPENLQKLPRLLIGCRLKTRTRKGRSAVTYSSGT